MVDWIVLAVLLLYAMHGWRKGIIRSLLGPFSFIVSLFLSIYYFQIQHNFLYSFLIGLFGPFIIHFLLSMIFSLKNDNEEGKTAPGIGNLLGMCVGIGWGAGIVAITLLFIALIPLQNTKYAKWQKDVLGSRSFTTMEKYIGGKIPFISQAQKTLETSQDPAKMEKFKSSAEAQAISNNAKIKAILDDEETMNQMKSRDIPALMQNPKFFDVLKDKELMEDFLKLYNRIQEGKTPAQTP